MRAASSRRDGITRDMRFRKHAQTPPSPVPLALLLIDVLTTFQFPDGDAILRGALRMSDALVRLNERARALGILIAISTDAHSIHEFGTIRYGIEQARRAGLERTSVLNCQPLETLTKHFQEIASPHLL